MSNRWWSDVGCLVAQQIEFVSCNQRAMLHGSRQSQTVEDRMAFYESLQLPSSTVSRTLHILTAIVAEQGYKKQAYKTQMNAMCSIGSGMVVKRGKREPAMVECAMLSGKVY